MDLVRVWIDLGFILFTLNIVQYSDVTDLLDYDQMCGYLTFDFAMWYHVGFGLLEVRVPRYINWLDYRVWWVVGIDSWVDLC